MPRPTLHATGIDYSFRKEWIRKRLEALASVFAVDVLIRIITTLERFVRLPEPKFLVLACYCAVEREPWGPPMIGWSLGNGRAAVAKPRR